MIGAVSIYDDVRFDVNKENGYLSAEEFNGSSWKAQLKLLRWLTGGETGVEVPQMFISQKNRDRLSPFLEKYPAQISNAVITKPIDYYLFDNIYKLNGKKTAKCDDDTVKLINNKAIDLLSNSKFYERVNTDIEEEKPSPENPICKMVGRQIEFYPKDLGSVVLEYIRLPKKAIVTSSIDPTTHDEVIASNQDFEWEEGDRDMLVWFIVDEFSNHTRESALKQFNNASNPVGK